MEGNFEQNGQKLNGNYKINILGENLVFKILDWKFSTQYRGEGLILCTSSILLSNPILADGGYFGQNGQKLHENYKINILEAK